MFQVLPYNENCCGSLLGRQVFDELSSEEEEEILPSRNSKKAKMEPIVLSLSYAKEEKIDPSCGIKDEESPCYLHSGKSSKAEPSKEELHAAVVNILKEVDFNSTTLSDIIQLLGSHFSVDLMHRKAEVKTIVTDVISNMIDKEESVDPSRDGENPCYAESGFITKGDKSDDKVDNMVGVEKQAPILKEQGQDHVKNFDKPKRPASVKGGRKRAKDPNKPKRSISAYLVFCEEFRKQYKKEHPNNKSVAAGEKWRQFSDAEKTPYIVEAEKREVEYVKIMHAYNKRKAAEFA